MQIGRKCPPVVFHSLSALAILLMLQTATQAQSPSKTVPLASDSCPVVHNGDRLAFEWNPAFDPEYPVTGVAAVNLQFARLLSDGVNAQRRPSLELHSKNTHTSITAIGNGFYRFEVTVRSDRRTQMGVYRLASAKISAQAEEDYRGPKPQMTQSPVESRYCITLQSGQ